MEVGGKKKFLKFSGNIKIKCQILTKNNKSEA